MHDIPHKSNKRTVCNSFCTDHWFYSSLVPKSSTVQHSLYKLYHNSIDVCLLLFQPRKIKGVHAVFCALQKANYKFWYKCHKTKVNNLLKLYSFKLELPKVSQASRYISEVLCRTVRLVIRRKKSIKWASLFLRCQEFPGMLSYCMYHCHIQWQIQDYLDLGRHSISWRPS